MRIAALLALVCLLAAGTVAETAQTKKSQPVPSKKSTKTSSKATTKGSKTSAKRRKGSRSKSAAWRSRQLAPTPDRYKEIQSALADRGYLKQSPTGVWDGQSADALKRFQQDQNLEPNGKLNSLSLIALGLGAKHGNAPPIAPVAISPQGPAPVLTPRNMAPHNAAPQSPPPAAPTAPPNADR